MYKKRTLREHLSQIDQNSVANQKNFDSLTRRMKKYFIEAGYPNCAELPFILEEYVQMIFETQGFRCTHWLQTKDGELNGVWNRPGNKYYCWSTKQVFYEIDHVMPVNAGGKSRLDNFQFLSPNANQFVKTSLTYEDLLRRVDLSTALKNRIRSVLQNREKFFKSKKWKDFIHKCEKIEGRA